LQLRLINQAAHIAGSRTPYGNLRTITPKAIWLGSRKPTNVQGRAAMLRTTRGRGTPWPSMCCSLMILKIMRRSIRRLLEEYPGNHDCRGRKPSFPETVLKMAAKCEALRHSWISYAKPSQHGHGADQGSCLQARCVLAISIFNDEATRYWGPTWAQLAFLERPIRYEARAGDTKIAARCQRLTPTPAPRAGGPRQIVPLLF